MEPVSTVLRVRYEETDMMGLVYYATHLVWFEVARTEFFRRLGIPYSDIENKDYFLITTEAYCKYLLPLKYDDVVKITIRAEQTRKTAIKFQYELSYKDTGDIVANGYTTHIFTDKKFKPVRMPEEIKKLLK